MNILTLLSYEFSEFESNASSMWQNHLRYFLYRTKNILKMFVNMDPGSGFEFSMSRVFESPTTLIRSTTVIDYYASCLFHNNVKPICFLLTDIIHKVK